MSNFTKSLFAATVAILAAMPAKAADPAYCEAYASLSVAQYQMGVAKGLPGLAWPRWHNDANGHRWWCLQPFVSVQAADAEIAARHSVIN